MLKLKPIIFDWLAVSAQIPTIIFFTPSSINPQTCTCIRLLGPCFKTGQMIHPHHNIFWCTCSKHCSTARQPNTYDHIHCYIQSASFSELKNLCCLKFIDRKIIMTCLAKHTAHTHHDKHNKCTNLKHTVCSNFTNHQQFHLLPFQQVQVLLTFFSKSFSQFPQGTCLLSASNQYLALDELYHQLSVPLPRNTILKHMPHMKRSHMTDRAFTFNVAFPQTAYMHTFIGDVIQQYNSGPKAQIII